MLVVRALAIDTALSFGSIALLNGDATYEKKLCANPSEVLLPSLKELLHEHSVSLDQLNYMVCHQGPGAFTGLRVGASVAQGLSLGIKCPLYGICGLQSAAESYRLKCIREQQFFHPYVWVLQDARLGELFSAAFFWNEFEWEECLAPVLLKPEELSVPMPDASWVTIGTGWEVYPALQERYAKHINGYCSASVSVATSLLSLAQARYISGVSAPVGHLKLNYVRDRVAQTVIERAEAKRIAAL